MSVSKKTSRKIEKEKSTAQPRAAGEKATRRTKYSPWAVGKLAESDLTPDDATQLGITEHTEEESAAFGLSRKGAGLRIQYSGLDGEAKDMFRYRYQQIEGTGFLKGVKQTKYLQPPNTDQEVYWPRIGDVDWPKIVADPNVDLVITEGEFKAACLTKHGAPCIGIGGVYNFGSKARNQKLLPDLQAVDWHGRKVYIIYDSDAVTNPNVIIAENRLARRLLDKNAQVYVVRLPKDGDKKIGCDDYVVKHGVDALKKLMEETKQWKLAEEQHKLNAEVVYVREPNLIAVFPTGDRPTSFYAPTPWVNDVMANRLMEVIDAKGNPKQVSAAAAWMRWPSRNEVERITFAPNEPLITDKNELNMWMGWGYKPWDGDISAWLKLHGRIFPEPVMRAYSLQWLAYLLQHPGAKLSTALVVVGPQGVGKSLLFAKYTKIFGRYASIVGNSEVKSRFNSWSANKLFVLGEEITGGHGRDVADKLKHLITGSSLQWEEKCLPVREIPNLTNFAFLTNRANALHLDGNGDRRYAVSETVSELADPELYRAVAVTDPGALFGHLLNVDLTGFNPHAHAPMTQAKAAMIDASLSQVESWVRDLKENPDCVTIDSGPHFRMFSLHTADELLTMFGERKGFSVKALTLALREAGFAMACDGRVIRGCNGRSHRLWIVRDAERLRKMREAKIAAVFNSERDAVVPKKFAHRVVSIREAK